MDQDGIFEVEADVHASLRARRAADKTAYQHRGENALRAARGYIRPAQHDLEQEPLLQADRQQSSTQPDVGSPTGSGSATPPEGLNWPGQKDLEGLPWWKRPSVFWLLPLYCLFALSVGGIMVPRFNLINNLICRDFYLERAESDPRFYRLLPDPLADDNEQCNTPQVSSRVVLFMLGITLIDGILGMLTSAKLGSLSDRYGRNIVLACITLGAVFNLSCFLAASYHLNTFNPYWLYVGAAVDGLCGSFTAAVAVVHAYAADCTPPIHRNVVFGYFHVCIFGGIAIGPILSGILIKHTGNTIAVWWFAVGTTALFLLVIAFLVPESVPKHRQHAAREKYNREKDSLNPYESKWITRAQSLNLFAPLKILWPTGPGTSPALRRNLVLVAAIDATMFGTLMGMVSIILAYTKTTYGWGNYDQSIYTSVVNSSRTFWLFVALPIVTRLIRGPASTRSTSKQHGCDSFDLALIRTSIVVDMVGYILYAFAPTGLLFIMAGSFASIGGVGSPTLQSALTKHVPHDRVGQVLGASGFLHALARVIGPTLFNAIYVNTVAIYSSITFLSLAGTFGIAAVMSFALKPGVYYDEDAANLQTHNDELDGNSDSNIGQTSSL